MAGFNIIILSEDENVLTWLNSDEVEIEESRSTSSVRSISLTLPIQDGNQEFKNLFKMGNKIYIPSSEVTESCLYVINTQYTINYWADNTLEVEAEEVLVELNYAEPFYYAGEKIRVIPVSDEWSKQVENLDKWFGDYYNIGKVNYPTSEELAYIEPCGSMTKMELLNYIEEQTGNKFVAWYDLKRQNNSNTIVRYLDFLQPQKLGVTHSAVLDLGYNTDDMEYEVDESDTYKAIAPLFSAKEDGTGSTGKSSSSNSLTTDDVAVMINDWLNLEVKLGQTIPKVVEKYTQTSDSGTSEEKTRYTEYWEAPFLKNKGEFYIYDEVDSAVEYDMIHGRADKSNISITPKMGHVSTSETDKYAIFTACAEELIEKRYPEIKITVDAHNLNKKLGNSTFSIWDKVHMKVPSYNLYLLGRVTETKKNPHLPGKDKITISNCKDLGKQALKSTYMEVSDTTVVQGTGTYFKGKLYARYEDELGQVTVKPLANKLVTVTVILEDKQESVSTSTTSTTTSTSSFNRLGVSSDGSKIMAIGKPSASGESSKYGYTYYKSVFKRKCPFCGSTDLMWAIWWAGKNKSCGKLADHKNQYECGSIEGHIFCNSCDADFSCIDGKDHSSPPRKTLTRVSGPEKSSADEATKLREGKYGTSSTVSSTVSGLSVDAIMREASTITYKSPSCSPSCANVDEGYECVKKKRIADCFGMSAYLYRRLNDNGHRARIVVYYSPYASSGTHRTVQVYENNTWSDPSYSGFDTRFKAMSNKKNMSVCKDAPAETSNTSSTTTTTSTTTNKVIGFKKAYNKKTDENGEFKLQINLESQEYKLQCSYGGDTEYDSCSSTVNLVVAPANTTNVPSTASSTSQYKGGDVCKKLSELTGVTINSIDTLYKAFTKTKYKMYYNEEVSRTGAYTRIKNGKGLNCVDLNQLAYYALKELNVNVRICRGVVHCSSNYGHIWCEINTGNGWSVFDASAAAKGKARGKYICGTSATRTNINPAWLLSDDGKT